MDSLKRRINIFKNGKRLGGKVLFIPNTWEELLQNASTKLGLIVAKHIYNEQGCELDDINLIRDEDTLFIAGDEPFVTIVTKTGVDFMPAQCELHPNLSNACSCEFICSKTNRIKYENGTEAFVNATSDIASRKQQNMVKLNVGGQYFCTSRTTLLKEPESMLAKMFCNELPMTPSSVDESGTYFIDRSPEYFAPILNYLRDGKLIIGNIDPYALFNEAQFYGVESLLNNWGVLASPYYNTVTRKDIVKALYTAHSSDVKAKFKLQFQHANLRGVDLSGLTLSCVDFSFACFQGCLLVNTTFDCCTLHFANFDGADMRNCIFRGYKMLTSISFKGAKMCGATFWHVFTLTNIEFKDACLCGSVFFDIVSLTNIEFEDVNLSDARFHTISDLTDIDLGGANLENVSLIALPSIKNCNFKTAVCKGMHLQNCTFDACDFTGVDLKSISKIESSNFINSKLISADFSGVHLENLTIENSKL